MHRVKQQNKQLKEENNLLKIKIDLLLDMVSHQLMQIVSLQNRAFLQIYFNWRLMLSTVYVCLLHVFLFVYRIGLRPVQSLHNAYSLHVAYLKQEALLWQRDCTTRLSVEILELQNIIFES